MSKNGGKGKGKGKGKRVQPVGKRRERERENDEFIGFWRDICRKVRVILGV